VRWRSGAHSASISAFRTRFSNFIALVATGNTRDVDGELLPEAMYQAVPAVFRGFEAQARLRVYERSGALDLLLRGDYVKAENRSTGQPLPRISPLRLGVGLEYALNRFTGGIDVQKVKAQTRVAPNETTTPGYTLVNASLAYTLAQQPVAAQAFVRINNLFDKEARNHVSFLKDIAPLPGRGVLVGLRASF
jgi:iron complex outermembrane recepter protein